jgi:hypothetical protein
VAILFFTVTLAASALSFKLQRSSVPEMQKILEKKKKERDALLEKMSNKELKEQREKKLDEDLAKLVKMGDDDDDDDEELPMPSAPSSSSAFEKVVKMEDDDNADDDFKRFLMEERGLAGAELQEELVAYRAAKPVLIASAKAKPLLKAQPKHRGLQRIGVGHPLKRPAQASIAPPAKKTVQMKGSVITG